MTQYVDLRTREGSTPFLYDPLFGVPHGFSVRAGGVTKIGYLSSLNLGYDRGDDNKNVDENRNRFIGAVSHGMYDRASVVSATQIHSADVRLVTEADLGRSDFRCDGFVTSCRGVPLLVKTADCLPLLFCDREAGVIAAVHSGWRGTVLGIAQNAVEVMVSAGADRHRIRMLCGPSIRVCCFTVGEDFLSQVRGMLSPAMFDDAVFRTEDGQWHADLCRITESFLCGAGVLRENIRFSRECSCCHPETFFSHRATGGKRGLSGALVLLS